METFQSNKKLSETMGYEFEGKSHCEGMKDINKTCSAFVYDLADEEDIASFYSSSTASHTEATYESSNKSPERFNFFACEKPSYRDDVDIEDQSDEENNIENGNLSYFERYKKKKNIDKVVNKNQPEMKEVTIMPIGSRSRAHFVVKGAPKINYSVAGMCTNQGLQRSSRSKQKYRLESPRTGQVFHRIKPRPVLMDTTKISTNSAMQRNSTGNQTRPQTLEHHKNKVLTVNVEEDDISMITTPTIDLTTSTPKALLLQEPEGKLSPSMIVSDPEEKPSLPVQLDETKIKPGATEVESTTTESPNSEGKSESGNRSESNMSWRKKVPSTTNIPQESIESVEIEFNEKSISSNLKTPLWNKSTETHTNFNIIIEEVEIDQETAGRPLSPKEIKKLTTGNNSKQLGRRKLRTLIRGTKNGLFSSIARISSAQNYDVDAKKNNDEQTLAVQKERKLVVNADGLVSNRKVIYRKIGTDESSEMKVLKINEDIIPKQESSDVLIQIEASSVSKMDAKIRYNHIYTPFQLDGEVMTPGIDIVGRVVKSGDIATVHHGIYTNDRVASLVGCGGNSTYISLNAADIVRVPTLVSRSSASIVIESYLPAYQALLSGMQEPEKISMSCLQNKNILIFGGISTVGQAMIELSLLFGAKKVYTTAISKHHKLLKSFGAIPLETDSRIWTPEIQNSIDIAVEPSCDEPDKNSLEVIKTDGILVCFGRGKNATGTVGLMSRLFSSRPKERFKKYEYNVFDAWKQDIETSKSDLSYLFGLLKSERIEPQLAATLKLSKVQNAHTHLNGNRRIQGTFVCLPSLE